MEDKRYGEFDNFDDFFADLLNDLDSSAETEAAPQTPSLPEEEVPVPRREARPAEERIPSRKDLCEERSRKKKRRQNRCAGMPPSKRQIPPPARLLLSLLP